MKSGACRVSASGAAPGGGTQVMPGDGLLGAPEKPLLILNVMPLVLGATVAYAAAVPGAPGAPAAPAGPAGPVAPVFPAGPALPGLPAFFFATLAAIFPTSAFSGPVSRPAAKAAPVVARTIAQRARTRPALPNGSRRPPGGGAGGGGRRGQRGVVCG